LSLSSSVSVLFGGLIFFCNRSLIHRHTTTSPLHRAHTRGLDWVFAFERARDWFAKLLLRPGVYENGIWVFQVSLGYSLNKL